MYNEHASTGTYMGIESYEKTHLDTYKLGCCQFIEHGATAAHALCATQHPGTSSHATVRHSHVIAN